MAIPKFVSNPSSKSSSTLWVYYNPNSIVQIRNNSSNKTGKVYFNSKVLPSIHITYFRQMFSDYSGCTFKRNKIIVYDGMAYF